MGNWELEAFSVIVKTECETDGDESYAALLYSGYMQGFFGFFKSRQTGGVIRMLHEIHFLCIYHFFSFFTSHESDSGPTTAEGNLDFTLF